ncbi:MAG: TetR/AcrR family transcriptional regulator [Natrialbaceae archaeon]|nr:TetR/AcrR family transcriptional regulator [Natrialbaceae archaeon]
MSPHPSATGDDTDRAPSAGRCEMEGLFSNPETTREAILGAAFRALCEHGYADLTIDSIGAEFDKSPSLVYHHYEDKDDLMVGLLEYLLEEFQTMVAEDSIPEAADEATPESSAEWLTLFINRHIDIDPPGRRTEQFLLAIIELRAQATHNSAYRDHFDRSDRIFHQILTDIIQSGIDDGTFTARDIDPAAVAATLLAIATGAACHRGSTKDQQWLAPIVDETHQYVQCRLYAETNQCPTHDVPEGLRTSMVSTRSKITAGFVAGRHRICGTSGRVTEQLRHSVCCSRRRGPRCSCPHQRGPKSRLPNRAGGPACHSRGPHPPYCLGTCSSTWRTFTDQHLEDVLTAPDTRADSRPDPP